VLAEALIKGEEGGLHGFHEEAVLRAGDRQYVLELANVESSRFFAKDMLAGTESLQADLSVGVGMRGDVDRVDVGREQGFESSGDSGNGKLMSEGAGAFGVATPDDGQGGRIDSQEPFRKAGSGAAGADNGEADGIRGVGHRKRVARQVVLQQFAVLRVIRELVVLAMVSAINLRGWY